LAFRSGSRMPGRLSGADAGAGRPGASPGTLALTPPGRRRVAGYRPSRAELAAAVNLRVPDLIAPDLRVLFCGINPGLYSAATGHHFARPGNRFWPALHQAGFTDRLLKPWEENVLLNYGIGITNLVSRATATADQLTPDELRAGRRRLALKVRRFRPRCVAVVGIGAYRLAFGCPKAGLGPQAEQLESAAVWVLPNTSGLNANHQLPDLTKFFRALRKYVG
jgi:double-stranded uracil-DNA glycosylase